MAKIDFKKLKAVDSEALNQQVQEEKEKVQQGNSYEKIDFFTLKPGSNIRRIYPSRPDENMFIAQKVVHWMPQEVFIDKNKKEVRETDEEKLGKMLMTGEITKDVKRKPIFNSRVHGTFKNDEKVSVKGKPFQSMVEAYIYYVTEELRENLATDGKSEKEIKDQMEKKLNPITDWKLGISASATYVFYCDNIEYDGKGGKKVTFGKQEISWGIKEKLNALSMVTSGGTRMMKDKFSDVETGKAVDFFYDDKEKDNKKKYTPSLVEDDCPLTEDQIDYWAKFPSLKEMFIGSYKRADFLKELNGLRIFDQQNKFNIFSHSEWQEAVAKFDVLFTEEDKNSTNETKPEEKADDQKQGSDKPAESSSDKKEEEPNYTAHFESMDRSQLIAFIAFAGLDIQPKDRHDEARIVEDIVEELKETKFKGKSGKKLDREIEDLVGDYADSLQKGGEVKEDKKEEVSGGSSLSADAQSKIDALKNKYKNGSN